MCCVRASCVCLGYQVVIPKEADPEEDEAGDYGLAPEQRSVEKRQRHLRRLARPAPVPKDCYALGSLHNTSFSVIKARERHCDT